jgi:hypothetical protein
MDKDDFYVVVAVNDETRGIGTGTSQDELAGGDGFPIWGVRLGGSGADAVLEDRIVVFGGRARALADIGDGVGAKQIAKEAAFKEREVPLIVRREL